MLIMKKINNNQQGQTLIEVLVAIVVAGLLLVALSSLIISLFRNQTANVSESKALQYAQEGVNYLESITNSTSFANAINQGEYCLSDISTANPIVSCPSSGGNLTGGYLRTFTLKENTVALPAATTDCPSTATTEVEIDLSVKWNDRSCNSATPLCHISSLETCVQVK